MVNRFLVAAVVSLFNPKTIPAVTSLFDAPANYTVAGEPRTVFVSDLDGDGHPDLAIASNYANRIYILKNSGSGSFVPNGDYPIGVGPRGAIASDINGDGSKDLIGANSGSNSISVLINNGDGTFAAKIDYPTGNIPVALVAADVDGDGDQDLAVANQVSATVSVFRNNGDGTFAAAVPYGAGAGMTGICAADFDRDGHVDIAISGTGNDAIFILMNNGDGTFSTGTSYSTGNSPIEVFAADLNGDGFPDLVAANTYGNTVSVLINNQDGTFAAKQDYATGARPWSVFASDFDGDGHVDLVATNSAVNTVSVLKNLGNGTFATREDYGTWLGPTSVFASDLDGDGDLDLAIACLGSKVSVLKNLSNISIVPEQPTINAVLDAGTGDKLVVKWSAPLNTSNITDYEVGWGPATNNYPNSKIIPADGHSSFQAVIGGLQAHTPYFVAVRSRNANTGNMSGWAWAHRPDTGVYATIPVVLVHGWKSSPEIWDVLNSNHDYKGWLMQAHFNHIWIADNLARCGTWASDNSNFCDNANLLADYIESRVDSLKALTGGIQIHTINIVAHSMGGLISRRYINPGTFGVDCNRIWFHRTVKNLIMLGTPNSGTNLGRSDLCVLHWCNPAACDLGRDNILRFNLSCPNLAEAITSYYVVSGSGGHSDTDCKQVNPNCNFTGLLSKAFFEGCPNDGIVSRSSAEATVPSANIYLGGWCHDQFYTDSALFTSFVEPILEDRPVIYRNSTALRAEQDSGTQQAQVAFSYCDSIRSSELRVDSINVESGNASILLLSSDSLLTMYLESPSGKTWDSLSAPLDNSVLYQRTVEGTEFSFSNVESGKWSVHYDSRNLPSSGARFCLLIASVNSVNLQARLSDEYPLPNKPLLVTAILMDNSTPVTGAMVTAQAIHENLDTLPLFYLFDDGRHNDVGPGDGIYAATFNQTVDSGLVDFQIVAMGSAPSTGGFRREATISSYITLGIPVCGDLNRDRQLTAADVVSEVNCVFLEPDQCDLTIADVNGNGTLAASDIVLLVNAVFLGARINCSP